MRTSFSGLEIALSGLYTSQKAINIASNNISNAATPGYSRQVGEIVANQPYTALDGAGMVGTGSQLISTNRVRDGYLDYRYWNENSTSGEWSIKNTSLSDIQALFNEPSDSGFTTVMNSFYSALQDLSKDPASLPARAVLKENSVTLSRYFNNMSNHMQSLQADYNFDVKSKVDEVNSYAKQVRDLNELIYKYELDGTKANDLRDKRQLLVDKLSQIADVDVDETQVGTLGNGIPDMRFSISIGGHVLANHLTVSQLEVVQRGVGSKQNPSDIDGLYDVKWADGNPMNLGSGELKAYIDVRDGNGDITTGSKNQNKGLPFYQECLNKFVRTFVQSFNEGVSGGSGFTSGYGLDGSTGIKLFTANGSDSASFTDYTTLTAANMGVSADILADDGTKKIPASDTFGTSGNSGLIQMVLDQRHDTAMFAEGAPEDYMKSLIATLGVDAQEAIKMNKIQDSVVKHIENSRQAVSGVSIDEETANVVKYQQIYTASAKLISIMDELYSLTVNRLGMAGR